jgi:hypothetical protein
MASGAWLLARMTSLERLAAERSSKGSAHPATLLPGLVVAKHGFWFVSGGEQDLGPGNSSGQSIIVLCQLNQPPNANHRREERHEFLFHAADGTNLPKNVVTERAPRIHS